MSEYYDKHISLSLAETSDAKAINMLLNTAYRGDVGWTNESELIAGSRSMIEEIEKILAAKNAIFLVYKQSGVVVACICLEVFSGDVYVGSFAVSPSIQAQGIGAKVLAAAESYSKAKLGATKFSMSVIEKRTELIAYYERRGYVRTGKLTEYPVHLNVGEPIDGKLMLVHLIKSA